MTYSRVCRVCGRSFETPFHRKSTCSPECAHEAMLARLRAAAAARQAELVASRPARSCVVCGARLDGMRYDALVCSTACAHRYRTRRSNGEPVADSAHVQRCAQCGREFVPTQWRQRFCAPECCGAWQRAHDAERYRRDAAVESGKLSDAQAEQVRADMRLSPSERYAASKSWSRAMRDHARRLYEGESRGGIYAHN